MHLVYFTSKPALKGLVRKTSNILNSVRQLNAIAAPSNVDEWNSPEQVLERAAGLSQHHDGITGTSKEHVTQNYEYRIFKAWNSIESVLQSALQGINQREKGNTGSFPVQVFCRTLNESSCDFTKNNQNSFSILLVNGNSRDVQQLIQIPVYGVQIALVDQNDNPVEQAWVLPTFVNGNQVNNSQISPYDLQFVAEIPAFGFNTYFVVPAGKKRNPIEFKEVKEVVRNPIKEDPVNKIDQLREVKHSPLKKKEMQNVNANSKLATKNLPYISNGLITVNFDEFNLVKSVVDIAKGVEYPLKQSFWYYEGHDNNGKASGAYIFRPQSNEATAINQAPGLSLAYLEARQVFNDWVSQTVRLIPNKTFVEFDWTVGPLPEVSRNGKNYGKEVITRYETIVNSGTHFYTDANGRQFLKRIRNYNPDYTYENSEPVASNYYPVNAVGILKDDDYGFGVLTDRSQAGGSIKDSTFELLLHRRDFYDDGKGVDENLNEPGNDGRGLVVRGKHRVILSSSTDIYKNVRQNMNELFYSPLVSFSNLDSLSAYTNTFLSNFSAINQLPENVKILTLKQLSPGSVLLRLEHFFAANEDSQLSQPVTVDIKQIFKKLKVNSIQETTLGSNRVLQDQVVASAVTLNPQDIRTFIIGVSY